MGVLQAAHVKHCTCQVIFSACMTSWRGTAVSWGQEHPALQGSPSQGRKGQEIPWDGMGQSQAPVGEQGAKTGDVGQAEGHSPQ